jgi:hypothetical protein
VNVANEEGKEKGGGPPVKGPSSEILHNPEDGTFCIRLYDGRMLQLDPGQATLLARGRVDNVFEFLSTMLSSQIFSSLVLANLRPTAVFPRPAGKGGMS